MRTAVAAQAPDQRRIGVGGNERLVTGIAHTSCEQINLALSPAPLATRVDVQHAKRHERGKMRPARAPRQLPACGFRNL
jgi:hypothetical protein